MIKLGDLLRNPHALRHERMEISSIKATRDTPYNSGAAPWQTGSDSSRNSHGVKGLSYMETKAGNCIVERCR